MNLSTQVIKTSGLLLLVAVIQACSTGLSKEECALADWRQIGYEDGSVGRNLNHIGRHRKSCAKAGVAPDFNAYKRGHTEGLNQWCNYDNGLSLGESGRNYGGICPKNLEGPFLDGYQYGRRLFEARSLVASIRGHINASLDQIEHLEDERIELGELIILSDTSKVEKVKYLARINEIGDEITGLELYIADQEKALVMAERKLQNVRP